jgi:hypothetical protein
MADYTITGWSVVEQAAGPWGFSIQGTNLNEITSLTISSTSGGIMASWSPATIPSSSFSSFSSTSINFASTPFYSGNGGGNLKIVYQPPHTTTQMVVTYPMQSMPQ